LSKIANIRELEAERRYMREAERKRIEELEREVRAIQTSNQQLASQTNENQMQVAAVQKTMNSQFGPFGFGDRINAFLDQHYFTMVSTPRIRMPASAPRPTPTMSAAGVAIPR